MSSEPAAQDPQQDLEFGLFDWIDAHTGVPTAQTYDARLRVLAEADRGGFSTYHIAEHHGTPLGLAPSPSVFIAAAARETERIRLAPTTFIVPLYDPLRLVQEIAMLDQLSHGRLDVGVGKGSSPIEAAMYGLTPQDTAERFEALFPAIVAAMESGRFRRPGAEGTAAEEIELHVPVYQRPHPPLWYPTSNADSIPRLGDEGYNVLFGFGFASPPLEVVREQSRIFFAHFRESAARGEVRYSLPGRTPRFGMLRHVVVAASDREAAAIARSAFADHYTSFTHLWRLHGSNRFTGPADFDQLVAERKLFVGSPETVAAQVTEAVTVGGINYLAGAFAWGSLDVGTVLSSVRLFRDEVIPAVRSETAGPAGLAASVAGSATPA
ncbi:LLM class flavin-dependent oxidoreductase [Geodermatophilus ruber]|uniref:Flavin-dependent oxidoreductase, luciferase family (Includes alkanesulfonate monooxygenase SsuD and methylene tetrahydromethanopterin reductase) n=1 Tax=Geodermatophilus ruber TaxID=504800 RepID=A0A1I4GPB7_9ACTN|nr:LLM class flavin-dependent oxidoreductase [Geodermatophilus ruber]SFL31759.1 Flavin-dependent oxidoreductase, luciferase family (includes alkanesulfonate monooxygenase SsuD and methylene tetrahydromethanopterin reductase) [Geodermatophilus ruber]